jgi:hypothetical protein
VLPVVIALDCVNATVMIAAEFAVAGETVKLTPERLAGVTSHVDPV